MAEDIKNKGQNIGEDKQLPSVSHSYSKREILTENGKSATTGRISDFLTGNIIATPKSISSKLGQSIQDIFAVTKMDGSINEEGNLVKLSAMQNRVIYSLCNQIFSYERKEVTEYLEALKRGETEYKLPKIFIYVPDICGDVFGEEEKYKPQKLEQIRQTLEDIKNKKVPQVYSTGTFKDENGEEHSFTIRELCSYINIGRERQIIIDKSKIYSAVEIEFSRIFFERNWTGKGSRNFQIANDTLEARLPSGRKITTDVYWNGLFPMAANYSWYYLWHRLKVVEKKIKEEDIIDSERIAQLKKDALTTPPIPFQRLKEAISFKSKHPEEEARFRKRLWEGMWALIDRGIITEQSKINWEEETFSFVFSESREPINKPGTKKEDEKKPGGMWAKYSPITKPGPKKGSPKRKKNDTIKEQELF